MVSSFALGVMQQLEKLSIEELRFARDRAQELMNRKSISEFYPGDRAYFIKGNRRIEGIVKTVNQKTVSLIVPGTPGWRVSPTLLTKIHPQEVSRG